jgi:hypothetical protein
MQIFQQIISTLATIVLALSMQVSNLSQSINSSINSKNNLAALAPTSGLIAHWKFDETSGTTAVNSSSGAGSLTLSGGAGWGSGKEGNSLVLDGINDTAYITATGSSGLDNASQFTISAWVKFAELKSGAPIFSKFVNGNSQLVISLTQNGNFDGIKIKLSNNGYLTMDMLMLKVQAE